MSGFLAVALLGMSCADADADTDLIGHYQFKGDFSNSVSEGLPSLTPTEDTSEFLSGGGWSWYSPSASSGFNLQTPSLSAYSIGISFSFTNTASYRKVIDFSGLTNEEGLYVYNSGFRFFGYEAGSDAVTAENQQTTIIMTRSSDGETNLYLSGTTAPLLTVTDTEDYYAITDSLNFFMDDGNGPEFSSGGTVFQIMVWDTALSGTEVEQAFEVIPEPTSFGLLGGAAFAAVAFRRFARKRSS